MKNAKTAPALSAVLLLSVILFCTSLFSCTGIYKDADGEGAAPEKDTAITAGSDTATTTTAAAGPDIKATEEKESVPHGKPVLYIGIMIHLEGNDNATQDKNLFDGWVSKIEETAALLEKYNAKGTFEAKPNFVECCKKWNNNVLLDLYQRGHGIGVHADVGGIGNKNNNVKDMSRKMSVMKNDTEELLGKEIRHVSGICSEADWVRAAIVSGYKFATGNVTMCGLCLSGENIPKGFTKEQMIDDFHGVFPPDLKDRIHPWRTSDGSNWLEDDPEGKLVILASDGVIVAFDEEYSKSGKSGKKMDVFDSKDIDSYIKKLKEALALSESGMVNIFYVGLSIGKGADPAVFEKWLESIAPYIDSGKAEWKTLPEMYDEYISVTGY